MGTHGRNAITRNGIHICHEQMMDGHYAMDDLTEPFLFKFNGTIPELEPTMRDQTDECEQEGFAHIDYDNKILYTSLTNPHQFLDDSLDSKEKAVGELMGVFAFDLEKIRSHFDDDQISIVMHQIRIVISNERKLNTLGWKVYYEVWRCPAITKCVNSCTKENNYVTKRGEENGTL